MWKLDKRIQSNSISQQISTVCRIENFECVLIKYGMLKKLSCLQNVELFFFANHSFAIKPNTR